MSEVRATAVLPKYALHVATACAKEPGRFALHCLRLSFGEDGIARVDATDGRMLVRAEFPDIAHDTDRMKHRTEGGGSVLIPGAEFAHALKNGHVTMEEPAHVHYMSDGSVRFEMPRWTVVIPAPAVNPGEFPPVDQVVPAPEACAGSPAGKPIGQAATVAGRALILGEKIVGGIASKSHLFMNGMRGASRLDVEGPTAKATLAWMPMAVVEPTPAEPQLVPATAKAAG